MAKNNVATTKRINKELSMLEDYKMPIQELKQDIQNVWGRL